MPFTHWFWSFVTEYFSSSYVRNISPFHILCLTKFFLWDCILIYVNITYFKNWMHESMFCGNKVGERCDRLQSWGHITSALRGVSLDLHNFLHALLFRDPRRVQQWMRPPANGLVWTDEGHPGLLFCPCMSGTWACAGSLPPGNKWGVTCGTNFLSSWPPCDPAKIARMMLPEAWAISPSKYKCRDTKNSKCWRWVSLVPKMSGDQG